jgi:hypothetical protein
MGTLPRRREETSRWTTMSARSEKRTILTLVAANVVTSILHYVDNVVYFQHYPEPTWLNPHLVDAAWFVMIPFGIAGCVLYLQGRLKPAYVFLQIFALMNLLVLGHYLIAPPWRVSFRINLFILLEAVSALLVGLAAAWLQFRGAQSRLFSPDIHGT